MEGGSQSLSLICPTHTCSRMSTTNYTQRRRPSTDEGQWTWRPLTFSCSQDEQWRRLTLGCRQGDGKWGLTGGQNGWSLMKVHRRWKKKTTTQFLHRMVETQRYSCYSHMVVCWLFAAHRGHDPPFSRCYLHGVVGMTPTLKDTIQTLSNIKLITAHHIARDRLYWLQLEMDDSAKLTSCEWNVRKQQSLEERCVTAEAVADVLKENKMLFLKYLSHCRFTLPRFPCFLSFLSLSHTRAHTSATKCKLMEGRKKEKIRGSEREKRRERLSGLSEPAGNGCGSMNQWMKRIVDDILVPNWIKLRNTEACDKNLRAHLLTLWISISLAFFDCWPSAISHVDWNSQFQLDENGMEFYSRWSNIPASPMSSRRCENPRMSLRMIVDYSKTGCL